MNEEIKEEEVNPTLDVKETKNTADKFISEVTAEAAILLNEQKTELIQESSPVLQIKEEILDEPPVPAKIPEKKERKKYTLRSAQNLKSIPMNNPKDSQEIEQKINENIEEKEDGTFRCKICNRINKNKATMGHHIESHMEGVEFGCLMCDQKFRSRHYLSKHVCPVYTAQKAKMAKKLI